MADSLTLPRPAPGAPGPIGQAVLRLVTRTATIEALHELSPRLRLLSLRSEAFRDHAHVAGDKIQVGVGGMALRTYTPLRRGVGDDTLELLAHVHGPGPAARWLAQAAPGDACPVRGPRRSLDLAGIDRSTVFFGDETSLGLALALGTTALGGLDTHFIFEVGDAAEVRAVLERLGAGMLRHAWLVERQPDDAHLAAIESALVRYAKADAWRQYVLSGRSTALQGATRALRRAGARPSQLLVKAYWAPGKTALD
jgi:ferric-chelate reductase (NADPH)